MKATPDQWAYQEHWAHEVSNAACLLELRARVEALEANSKSTSNDRQIRSSLVERVGNQIPLLLDGRVDDASARAAIREVVAWLRDRGGWNQVTVAALLEQEAKRFDA